MYENMMNKEELKWTNLDDKSIHYSDQYASFVHQSRGKFLTLASALFYDTTVVNNEQKAKKAIYKCLEKMPNGPFYYDRSNIQMAQLLHLLGDKPKALEIVDAMAKSAIEVMKYKTEDHTKNKPQYNFNQVYMLHERLFLPSCYEFYMKNGYKEKAKEMESFMEVMSQ